MSRLLSQLLSGKPTTTPLPEAKLEEEEKRPRGRPKKNDSGIPSPEKFPQSVWQELWPNMTKKVTVEHIQLAKKLARENMVEYYKDHGNYGVWPDLETAVNGWPTVQDSPDGYWPTGEYLTFLPHRVLQLKNI